MTTPVNVETFARAESDVAIKKIVDMVGFSSWFHFRAPVPIDQQKVIRMNRDTLYSSVVLDLSEPATITMPETNGRYQSLHVIDQDHYSYAETSPGRYEITQEQVGTRYAYIIVRTFYDPDDPVKTNALQDGLHVEGGGPGPLDIPDWDIDQMMTARDALNNPAQAWHHQRGSTRRSRRDRPDQTPPVHRRRMGWHAPEEHIR